MVGGRLGLGLRLRLGLRGRWFVREDDDFVDAEDGQGPRDAAC